MNLFQRGDFILNSGARSEWKIECDSFTAEDVEALAVMIARMVGPFSDVVGVPRGGLRLAEALLPRVAPSGPFLIVDDVLTTGGSITRARDEVIERIMRQRPRRSAINVRGAVVFARGRCMPWIHALFQMPECFWLK